MATVPVYTYERKFGSNGSGNGQFLDPHDISFDASGNLFVCDRERNDVQKFTNAGVYISKFGGPGSSNGQFNVPYCIQHTPDHAFIYVCDRDNNRVQKLDPTGAYVSKITTVNGQALDAPEDITFDKVTGDMYICDTGHDRIVKLDKNHNFILQWGSTGSGNGQFEHPHSINTDSVGNVFISCGDQPYIQKFTPTGTFIKKFGSEGTGPGQTQMFLEHMDIDIFGYVHLINNDSRPIINVWNTNGDWLTQYGNTSSGSANGQFKEPEHVTCDPSNGKPFVVDAQNQRIQVFSVVAPAPPTPPPVTPPDTGGAGAPLPPDVFGIKQLYPTKTSGLEWFSTLWNNAHPRTLTQNQFDPDDPRLGYHRGDADGMVINGDGTATFPNLSSSHRVFIDGPWLNTEMTVYARFRTDYSGLQLRSRSNHHGVQDLPYGLESTNPDISCGFGNYNVSWGGIHDNVENEVEVIHNLYWRDGDPHDITPPALNVWTGFKQITRTIIEGGKLKVNVQGWMNYSLTDQTTWVKVTDFTYDGTNVHVEQSGFEENISTCINKGDKISGDIDANTLWLNPGKWSWLRINDAEDVDLQFFSVREIGEQTTTPSTGILLNSDIMVRLSGGSGNIDPNQSKGGIESTTAVDLNNILHNLFSDSPPDQLGPGITKYRLVYIHNNSNTSIMKNIMVFVLVDSESLDTALFYSQAVAPAGEFENVIVNEIDVPPGTNFKFGDTISTGINLGDLQPQSFKGLWLKLVVEPGADPYPEDKAFIRIVADPGSASNLPGGGGTGGGGTGGGGGTTPPDEPPVQTTPTYSFCVAGDLSTSTDGKKTIAKMKGRNPALIFINGDCIYADTANSLKSELGTDWVAKTKISLGNHDVDESESQPGAKNSLKSTFSMPGDYYTFTLNNMFGVVMDSEISNSTSSAQYTNLKPKLEAAAGNSAIEWIFIFNHRPLYGPSSTHPQNENSEIQNWHAVWDSNKVTAAWLSHNHNLWRTKPLKKGSGTTPIVTSTETTEYVNPTGEFFIGSGAGGRSHYNIGSVPSWIAFDNDSTYGYWLVDIYTNPRKAVFRCFSNSDVLLHTFTVIHGGASKYGIVTMTALGFDGSTTPSLANDDSMDTMWQHTANPTWIQADLGTTKACSFVDIAWNGTSSNLPIYTFNIEYSTNGTTWISIIPDRQNTVNLGLERYVFPGSVNARYIRVNVKGNNVNTVAAILELDVGRLT